MKRLVVTVIAVAIVGLAFANQELLAQGRRGNQSGSRPQPSRQPAGGQQQRTTQQRPPAQQHPPAQAGSRLRVLSRQTGEVTTINPVGVHETPPTIEDPRDSKTYYGQRKAEPRGLAVRSDASM